MKLKYRFFLLFLLLSVIPVLILSSFSYSRYTDLTEKQTRQVVDQVFDQAQQFLNNKLEEITNISYVFNFHSEITESIVDDLQKYKDSNASYSAYDVFQSNQKMIFNCQQLTFVYEYINGIYIFTPSGATLGYGFGNDTDILYGYSPVNDEWYQDTLASNGKIYVSGLYDKDFIINSKPSISFSEALYEVFGKNFLGVLFIDCSPEVFDLSSINTLPDIMLLTVTDSCGNILYSNEKMLKTDLSSPNTISDSCSLDFGGLTLSYSADYEYLYKEFSFTRTIMLTISVLCILIVIIISFFTSNYISKPISYLSQKMSSQNRADLIVASRYLNRTDEIGVLYNEYNRMISAINQYIENELENKLILLDSQMKSLESQINSHFLYNTLDSINCIAEIEEVDSIATISLALGEMFRYSIKTQSELVPIADELHHVANYVAIQQIRFDNKFRMVYEIPEDLKQLRVLKLILQPIVENAFYHRLQYCHCGSYIKIHGQADEQLILLTISDDGAGMTEKQLQEIREKLRETPEFTELGHRNNQSIGLKNIHSRIVLYYGEGYGLEVKSKIGSGTEITLRLPRLKIS
ncbi:MAG: sensor histidine kinase [Candidatus Limivivens sp.]|nr:sensor histidine kinase [Candidatus Limivivens sp.]